MTPVALAVVIAAILVPGALYFRLGLREKRAIRSVEDFIPLRRFLSSGELRATVVAAGISMATVMVALINLAPLMGIALFWTIVTYALGFGILVGVAPRIMDANPGNLTIQAYLGQAYGSNGVRLAATIFTLIGYLSIFSMELLVSVSVLSPFFGSWVVAFAVVYLVFLLAYTGLGGYRGVVATDVWQLRFIVLSIVALVGYITWNYGRYGLSASFERFRATDLGSWKASLAFVLGIAAMNIPAPISDAGTWQRICSADSTATARRALRGAVAFFVALWSALIVIGCLHPTLRHLDTTWRVSNEPLMTGILRALGSENSVVLLPLLFLLVVGLFSAMISTADSLLIAAAQIALTGFRNPHWLASRPEHALRVARALVIVLAVGAFAIFLIFYAMSFDVVQLVFAIYGAQLAMFPTTAVALFLSDRCDLRKLRQAALASILGGFVAAWACAVYGRVTGSVDLQFYAPAFALAASAAVIVPGVLRAWRVDDKHERSRYRAPDDRR